MSSVASPEMERRSTQAPVHCLPIRTSRGGLLLISREIHSMGGYPVQNSRAMRHVHALTRCQRKNAARWTIACRANLVSVTTLYLYLFFRTVSSPEERLVLLLCINVLQECQYTFNCLVTALCFSVLIFCVFCIGGRCSQFVSGRPAFSIPPPLLGCRSRELPNLLYHFNPGAEGNRRMIKTEWNRRSV